MKKILASLLALCMVFSMISISALAAETEEPEQSASYTDIKGHWGAKAIERWTEYDIIKGIGNGYFDPYGQMTRGAFATVLARLMGYTATPETNPFTDVPDGAWYADGILKLYKADVMRGISETIAGPNEPITREQAAALLCRALSIKPVPDAEIDSKFKDVANVSGYAKGYVAALEANGWVKGNGNDYFDPSGELNRAAGMQMLNNMIAEYVNVDNAEKTITGEVKGIVLVVADSVAVTVNNATVTAPVVVAPNAEHATVTVAAGSTVADVVVMGSGATVEGDGAVENVEVTASATDATVNTLGTTVTNKSESPVIIPNGTVVKDQTVVTTSTDVIKGLTPVDTENAETDMPAVTATVDGTTVKLATVTAVPAHMNAASPTVKGNWVGVAFKPADESVTNFMYSFAATGDLTGPEPLEDIGDNIEGDAFHKGATFWFNAATTKTATVRLQWYKQVSSDYESVGGVTTYTIDLSDVKYTAAKYDLTVEKLVPTGSQGTVGDVTKITVDGEDYTSGAVQVDEGKEVTVTVNSKRHIATCLLYEGNLTQTAKVTMTKKETSAFEFKITFKMPGKNTVLGIGVLTACEAGDAFKAVEGLSACEANNTTNESALQQGISLATPGEGETPPED